MANNTKKSADPGKISGGMIAKIVIGVIFVISAFSTNSTGALFVGIAIGAGLIAWGLVPYLQAKKAQAQQAASVQTEAQRIAELPKVCKACGATTKGDICEYCGSRLE